MSDLRELKTELRRHLVSHGEPTEDLRSVPKDMAIRWLREFSMPDVPKRNQRFLNHFKVGADPEFIFESRGKVLPASDFRLHTGQFVGSDLDGLTAEIRPKPSRSVLETVASCLLSLRWLGQRWSNLLGVNWLSGAYLYKHPLGGHIHFGTRKARGAELEALDVLCGSLLTLGILPSDQQLARAELREGFGKPSDYRKQEHGLEYRTIPSWLDSPWQAFFCLTAAKLGFLDPMLVLPWKGEVDFYTFKNRVQNLFAFYKGRDDDALLAYWALRRRGIPRHEGNDFKARWGVSTKQYYCKDNAWFPQYMSPSKEDLLELVEHFTEGKPIEAKHVEPNWSPTEVPTGWVPVLNYTSTAGLVGMGELLQGVVTPSSPVKLKIVGEKTKDKRIRISSVLRKSPAPYETLKKEAEKLGAVYTFADSTDPWIEFSLGLRTRSMIPRTRRFLLSGLFSLCSIEQATSKELKKWKSADVPKPAKPGSITDLVLSKKSKFLYTEGVERCVE